MYRLISFDSVSLEYYNQVEPVGSGVTPTAYIPLADGGALDAFGGQQKAPGIIERVKSLRLQAATPEDLSDLYFGLMVLRGKRGVLTRRMVDGFEHWQYARLVEIVAARDYQKTQFGLIQDVDLRFITQEATWRGVLTSVLLAEQWYINGGKYLNAGLYFNGTLAVSGSPCAINMFAGSASDAGRAPVRSIKFTATAGDTAMTAIHFARSSGETLHWAGTLAAGKSLVIDTGKMQVKNDGVDAYAGLTFPATADMAAWFTLQPGDNTIMFYRTGGGDGFTLAYEFYEAWY